MNLNQPQPVQIKLSSLKMIGATIMNDMSTRYWALSAVKTIKPEGFFRLNMIHLLGILFKGLVITLVFFYSPKGFQNVTQPLFLFTAACTALALEYYERFILKNLTLSIIQNHCSDEDLASEMGCRPCVAVRAVPEALVADLAEVLLGQLEGLRPVPVQ